MSVLLLGPTSPDAYCYNDPSQYYGKIQGNIFYGTIYKLLIHSSNLLFRNYIIYSFVVSYKLIPCVLLTHLRPMKTGTSDSNIVGITRLGCTVQCWPLFTYASSSSSYGKIYEGVLASDWFPEVR